MTRPLLRLALAGLRSHAVRLTLTGFAVLVGVGFLAGTLVYGDTARAAFYDDLARSARNVDVLVEPPRDRLVEPAAVDRIRALDGVAAVDGRVVAWLGVLDRNGKLIMSQEHVGYALSVPGVAALAPYDVAAGRLPRAPGEVAVDKATVAGSGFVPGGPVTVLDHAGDPHRLTLVGVLDLGVNRLYGGSAVAALTSADLAALTRTERYAQVVVQAADGTDPAELRARVAGAVGPDHLTLTGDALRDRLAQQAAKYVDGFLAVLLGFGLVSLTVSAFVIYNTFAMLGAQRVRELSLLRCAGASRRQLAVAVALEAAILGVLSSLGGLVLSLLVGYGLIRGRELVASDIPLHAPVVRWPTVAVAVGFGTVVAVLAALVPALDAGRVSPLAALRATADAEAGAGSARRHRRRVMVAGALGGSGALAVLAGLPLAFPGLPLVLGGGMLALLGTVVAAPLLVPRAIRLIGWLPARVFGTVVRLAVANARRNPRRAAATSMALTVGVALMAMFSVLLATAREQAGRELSENFPVEFVLDRARVDGTPSAVRGQLPAELAGRLRAEPAFATVAEVRQLRAPLDPQVRVWAVPPDQLRGPLRPEVTSGSLDGLGPGTVAVSRQLAAERDLRVGDPVTLDGAGRLTVIAVYDDAPTDGTALLSWPRFTAGYGAGAPDRLLVDIAPGVTIGAARQALDGVLADYPAVRVRSLADQAAALAATLDELLGIFAALLGMSVLIAVLGIANTLSLSVVERGRESATMRALGLSRRQLGGMLLTEAALVAAVGALAGTALGVAVGWAAALGLISHYGHGLPTVPVGQLGRCAALAGAAAVLAALGPARAAGRAPIVAALAVDG